MDVYFDDNKIYLRMTYTASGQTVDTPWIAQWGQANTTIDANGFGKTRITDKKYLATGLQN